MRRSGSARGWWGLLAMLTSSPVAAEETPAPVALPGGGRAVPRIEKQKRGETCAAERHYFQIEGLPSATAADKINTRLRKELTVGRPLRERDCPDPAFGEDYLYFNRATVSGVWPRFLGVEVDVIFPGGTGRVHGSCAVYDLETGQRHDLRRYVIDEALAGLDVRLNEAAQTDGIPGGYFPLRAKEADVCLTDRGVKLRWLAGTTTVPALELPLTRAEVTRALALPPLLKAAAGTLAR